MVKYELVMHINNLKYIKSILDECLIKNNESYKYEIINKIANFFEPIDEYKSYSSFVDLINELVFIIEGVNNYQNINFDFNEHYNILIKKISELYKELKKLYEVKLWVNKDIDFKFVSSIIEVDNVKCSKFENDKILKADRVFNVFLTNTHTNDGNELFDNIINIDDILGMISSHVNNKYKNNYNYYYLKYSIEEAINKSNEIILGLSYAMHGIEPDIMGEKCVNLSQSSQDIFYSFEIAKKIINENASVKKCVLNLSYYSLFFDLSKSNNENMKIDYIYYPLLGEKNNHINCKNIEYVKLSNEINSELTYIFNFDIIEDLLIKKLRCNYKGYYNELNLRKSNIITNNIKFNELNFAEYKILSKNRADAHNKFIKYEKTLEMNLEILYEFCKYSKDKSVELIVLVLPTNNEYYKQLNPEFKKIFEFHMKELRDKFSIRYIDINKYSGFNKYDFIDPDHLNLQGAIKASNILRKNL